MNSTSQPLRFTLASMLLVSAALVSAYPADSSKLQTISVDELVKILNSTSKKPLILHVGPRMLYEQAHIAGSQYVGQAATQEGMDKLRELVATLPKNTAIVLYCGCCPWSHCPNVNPAYDAVRQLGFTHVQVLYIPNNFGTDWVNKGYPTVKGE